MLGPLQRALVLTILLAGAAAAAAGCGGAGGGGSAPNVPHAATTAAGGSANAGNGARATTTITLEVPPRSGTSAQARKPAYVSAATQGIAIGVVTAPPSGTPAPSTAPSPLLVGAVTPTSSNCVTASDGTLTCTFQVLAPVGNDTFYVGLFDQPPLNGAIPSSANLLSASSLPFDVINNATNNIALSLNGVVQGLLMSPNVVYFSSGKSASAAFAVTAYDADGDLIIGPGNYDAPISIAISGDPNATLSFAGGGTTAVLSAPGTTLTVNYDGGTLANGALTATVKSFVVGASAVGTSGNAVLSLGTVGGIASTMTLSSSNAPSGSGLFATAQTSPPPGVPVLTQSVARAAAQAELAQATTLTPIQYVWLLPFASYTYNGAPAFSFTGIWNSALAYYIGLYQESNPSAGYVPQLEGPGIINGSTLLFGGTTTALPVTANDYTVFALYATIAPAPTPTASVGVVIGIPSAQSQALYVSDTSATTVERFASNVLGNVAPTSTLTTGTSLEGIAFGSSAQLITTAQSPAAVRVYQPVSGPTTGAYSATPSQTITGSATGLIVPVGVATDTYGNIYVADAGASAILVFAPGANGNVAPTWTIGGSNTGISAPQGIVIGADNTIYLTNIGSPSGVLVFAPGTQGNVAPARTISGAQTGLTIPSGVTLDYAGDVIVNDVELGTQTGTALADAKRALAKGVRPQASSSGVLYVFAPGTFGNVAPIRTITGTQTGVTWPTDVASDVWGNIMVSAAGSAITGGTSAVLVFGPGANGNLNPIKVITGSSTGLVQPFGIAVSPTQP